MVFLLHDQTKHPQHGRLQPQEKKTSLNATAIDNDDVTNHDGVVKPAMTVFSESGDTARKLSTLKTKHNTTRHESIKLKNETPKSNKQGSKIQWHSINTVEDLTKKRKPQGATTSNIVLVGKPAECLIDTGAHTSFISEEYFKTINAKRTRVLSKKRCVTANGNALAIAGQTQLRLDLGTHMSINATFVIAKDLAQNVIIGVDILKPNGFIVDFKRNKLRWGVSKSILDGDEQNAIGIYSILPKQTKIIRTSVNLEIAPFSSELIWTPCEFSQQDVEFRGIGRKKSVEMVLAITNNRLPILVQNPTPIRVRYRAGDAIGSIADTDIVSQIKDKQTLNDFFSNEVSNEEVNAIQVEQNKTEMRQPNQTKTLPGATRQRTIVRQSLENAEALAQG
jgi:predicted aspartyl protease